MTNKPDTDEESQSHERESARIPPEWIKEGPGKTPAHYPESQTGHGKHIVYTKTSSVFSTDDSQLIIMISEGSCDTEDWSNDAENTDLTHSNLLHLNRY